MAVALPVHETFTYSVPAHLSDEACPGKRVWVPFGRRTITGYLLGPGRREASLKVKHVLEVLDDKPLFPQSMIPFFRWIATYYMHPLGQVIATALPSGLNLTDVATLMISPSGSRAARSPSLTPLEGRVLSALAERPAGIKQLRHKIGKSVSWEMIHRFRQRGWIRMERRVNARQIGPKRCRWATLSGATAPVAAQRAPQRHAIRRMLTNEGDLRVSELKARIPTAPALIRAMQKAGQVTVYEKSVYRDPFGDPIEPDRPLPLTGEQAAALDTMRPLLGRGFATVLLAGVTGSGKTEVYLNLTQTALDSGIQVLVLVPEIALISQTERRFRARFGDTVAVLHSGLSRGERYDQWRRIANGDAAIAVGVRSCIFAPFDHLGLIIVDEEHDGAYKQEGGLTYNARDLAVVRGRQQNALVVLGSATPSVQSWYNTTIGKYTAVALRQRVNRHPLPIIRTVDLSLSRDERGIQRYITPALQQEIRTTLDAGNQALIFLNRRGFAAFPICVDCSRPVRCKNCDITLTLHKRANAFRCHYCGFALAATSACQSCGSKRIRSMGVGTEKIEEAMVQLYPDARVARMDRDTMNRKGAVVKLLKKLKTRQIDILVGTQMVAKGHDFPGITLVGVVCADLTLNFPDFRAGERTFQLLAQVAGRAGRGERPGRVILQTFNPSHFSIEAAQNQDFASFYAEEIAFRNTLQYPPFSRMIAIRIAGADQPATAAQAEAIGARCQKMLSAKRTFQESVHVMGPIEAPLPRIANRHRWQILIKSPHPKRLHRFVRELVFDRRVLSAQRRVSVRIDVDPVVLM